MSDRFFIYNGKSSRDFEAYVFHADIDGGSARQMETIQVPGKSGDVLIDSKRYENREHIYDVVIYSDYAHNLQGLRSHLLSSPGYQRLEDTFYPEEFYQACYLSVLEPETKPNRSIGHALVEFTRKPQRFLKSGEKKTTFTSAGSIYNPTAFESQPLLRVYGRGTVGIGDNAVTISAADSYTDIDCYEMEAYKGAAAKNQYVTIQNVDYPVLKPGRNGVTLGSGITRVEIIPRWYVL